MRPAIDAVRDTGTAVAEVAMSYTGDLSDPTEKLYTLAEVAADDGKRNQRNGDGQYPEASA